MKKTPEKDIDQLNSFLRGELAAVESYNQCLEIIDRPEVATELRGVRDSHAKRVGLIRDRVESLGGHPSEDSGAWGTFAKLVEGGAKKIGEKAAVSALEEGEDHGRDDYKRDLKDLTPDTQQFVRAELLQPQLRTHQVMSKLKHSSTAF